MIKIKEYPVLHLDLITGKRRFWKIWIEKEGDTYLLKREYGIILGKVTRPIPFKMSDEKKIITHYTQHYILLQGHFDTTKRHFKNIIDDMKDTIQLLAGHQETVEDDVQKELENLPTQVEIPKWITEEEKKVAAKKSRAKNIK